MITIPEEIEVKPQPQESKQGPPLPTRNMLYGEYSLPEYEEHELLPYKQPADPSEYKSPEHKLTAHAHVPESLEQKTANEVILSIEAAASTNMQKGTLGRGNEAKIIDCMSPLLTWMFWAGFGWFFRKDHEKNETNCQNAEEIGKRCCNGSRKSRASVHPKVTGRLGSQNWLETKNGQQNGNSERRESSEEQLKTKKDRQNESHSQNEGKESQEKESGLNVKLSQMPNWWRRWWCTVSPWVIGWFQAVNIIRFLTSFKHISTPGFSWTFALFYELMVCQFFLYFPLSYFFIGKHFPTLQEALTLHEARFGLHVNYEKLKFWARMGAAGAFCCTVLGSLTIVVGVILIQAWRPVLSPFEDAEGVALVSASCFLGCVCFSQWNGFFSPLGLFLFFSHVVRVELERVTQDLTGLLGFHRDTGTEPQRDRDSETICRERQRGGLSGMNLQPQTSYFDITNKACTSTTRRTRSGLAGGQQIASRFYGRRSSERHKSRMQVNHRCSAAGQKFFTDRSGRELSKKSEKLQDRRNSLNTATRLPQSCHHEGKESAFDRVRKRHESIMKLLEGTQNSLNHLVTITYGSGIPCICLLIFAEASGDLPEELWIIVLVMTVQCIGYIIFFTVVGTMVHEAAMSSLRAIHTADWSSMSTSLMTKLQLLALRLTSGETGYSVFGFFTITRETFLMLLGTFVSYSVIVVQFQMGAPAVTSYCNATA